MSIHPEIRWAQRSSEYNAEKNVIFLSILVADPQDGYKLDVQPTKITFSGKSKAYADKEYAFTLDLFGEVEPDFKVTASGHALVLVLRKKDLTEEYWPRLTKDKKVQYVKTDFDKWKDQDEQDEAPGAGDDSDPSAGFDMSSMMGGGAGGMGGMMGGGGMPGMGGAGGMDMEKLMAQMSAMKGAEGLGDPDAGEEDDTSDEEMPPLEDASAADNKGKGKAKEVDE